MKLYLLQEYGQNLKIKILKRFIVKNIEAMYRTFKLMNENIVMDIMLIVLPALQI